jgi:hypothetical protein
MIPTCRTGSFERLPALHTEAGIGFVEIMTGLAGHSLLHGMHPWPIIDLTSDEGKWDRARDGETGAADYDIMCTRLSGMKEGPTGTCSAILKAVGLQDRR